MPKMNCNKKTAKQQQGFTIIQMVITFGIIAVVSTFGVLGIKNARAEYRLHNSARLFASYIEKARADAIRRHAADGAESSVETFGPGTSHYAITMDFGSGLETRTFELDPGMSFVTAAEKVTFDWRGRLTEPCEITKACVFQVHSGYLGRSVPVDVSGSGDITVDEQHFPDQLIPPVEMSEVAGDVYPEPTPTPSVEASPSPTPETDPNASPSPTPTPAEDGNGNGGGNGNDGDPGNGNGNPQPSPAPSVLPTPPTDPGPGATPTPSPVPPPCVYFTQSKHAFVEPKRRVQADRFSDIFDREWKRSSHHQRFTGRKWKQLNHGLVTATN